MTKGIWRRGDGTKPPHSRLMSDLVRTDIVLLANSMTARTITTDSCRSHGEDYPMNFLESLRDHRVY